MGSAQTSKAREDMPHPDVPHSAELQCCRINQPDKYATSHRDPYGHGLRIFRKQVVRRRDEDRERRDLEEGDESLKKVLYRVRAPLEAMTTAWPEDLQRQKKILGELYATLHYEPTVRAWAADTRRVRKGNEKDDEEIFGRDDEEVFGDLEMYTTPRLVKLWYWALPVLIFLLCFTIQSFLLHVTTREYILYMDTKDHVLQKVDDSHRNNTLLKLQGITPMVAAKLEAKQLDGRLPDLIASKLERYSKDSDIPLWMLDMSGMIPVGLFTVTYAIGGFIRPGTVGLWTKTFLVASIMALLKGFCDWITIVPDSAGWTKCQARLGEDVHSLRKLDFRTNFTQDMGMAIRYEIMGGDGRGRMRYCADMLISGHTYFAVLFSLSAYKMVRYLVVEIGNWLDADGPRSRILWSLQCLRRLIFFVCWLMIGMETVLVAMAKFHYTVDMVLSVILVVILWDSVYIETWSRKLTVGYAWRGRPIEDHPWCWGWCPCKQRLGERRKLLVTLTKGDSGRDWVDQLKSYLDDSGHAANARAERGLVRVVTRGGRDLEFRVASNEEELARNQPSWLSCEEESSGGRPWHSKSFPHKTFWFISKPDDGKDFPLKVYEVTRKLEPWQSNYLVDLDFLRQEVLEDPKALSHWVWCAPAPIRKLSSAAEEALAASPGGFRRSLLGLSSSDRNE